MSSGEAMKLDSTKRCLFPVEDELSLSGLISTKSLSGVESSHTTRDDADLNVTRNCQETIRNSPISVVCVISGGHPTLDSTSDKTSNTLALSSSVTMTEKSGFDDIEEQTVIEVQYVEAGCQGRNVHAISDLDKRKCCFETTLTNVKYSTRDFGDARAKPLLDMENTPSRSPTEKDTPRTPLFGCGGRGACLSVCDDSGHQLVERTITGFLEDNSVSTPDAFKTKCTDWQAWSYFGFRKSKSSPDIVEQNSSKENIRSILRSRASRSLRARKSNVRQLKQNLAPFTQSPVRSPARAPGLFRNRSFSVKDHRSAIVRVSKDKKRAIGKFADVLQLCTMYESIGLDSPDLITKHLDNKINDDDLSYDSDPEDFMRRRNNLGVEAAAISAADTESSYFEQSENLEHNQNSFLSPSRSLLDVHNDEIFSNIVQEIFNKTTTLVVHPLLDSNKPKSVQSARPVAVDAWLERGQHLAYALIQPKWIWKAKTRLNAEEQQSNIRQKFCLQGIELLDITRILKVEETERGSHSFAKSSHCFFVKSIHDEEFCFEAKSKVERDRVVSSLKLLIARFGAKVLTGDPKIYYEFFWINDAAPGKAPDLHRALVEDVGDQR